MQVEHVDARRSGPTATWVGLTALVSTRSSGAFTTTGSEKVLPWSVERATTAWRMGSLGVGPGVSRAQAR